MFRFAVFVYLCLSVCLCVLLCVVDVCELCVCVCVVCSAQHGHRAGSESGLPELRRA